jgi:hypothetical protein
MTQLRPCDSNLEKTASPFDRILCLGYYDGPTSGLARCAESTKAYRFELVAWDSGFENRIYSLAETDVEVFDSVVRMLARLEEPHWPSWVPRWQFSSLSDERAVSSTIDQTLGKISAASLLIATDRLDQNILACRALETTIRDRIPKEGTLPDPKDWQFWREYLGL